MLHVYCSLGVEPVDKAVMKTPPRRIKDHIINRHLIINVLISAAIIVCGTLWIFSKEVRVQSSCSYSLALNSLSYSLAQNS